MDNKKPIVLLNLRSDGKNGIIDTVTSNQWINDYGTKTKINKAESPFNNPNGCIEFAGGQDRLKLVKYNPNFDMSNTDWTVSLWAKYSSLPPYTNSRGFGHLLTHSDMWNGINNGSLWFSLYLGDDFSEGTVPGIATQIYTSYGHYEKFYTTKCDLREWTHIAWCYAHKTKKLFTFINGKKILENDCSNLNMTMFMPNDEQPLSVGGYYGAEGVFAYQGYVDDLTIVNNKALWTKDFTPPSTYLNIATRYIYIDEANSAWGFESK